MENTAVTASGKIHFKDRIGRFFKVISHALRNKTFLYIVRRTLSSIFTLLLLVAVVTALLRLLPDTKFYDVKAFNTIKGNYNFCTRNWFIGTVFQISIEIFSSNYRCILNSEMSFSHIRSQFK